MKLTDAAYRGFELGEESATRQGREFVREVMGKILMMPSTAQIHDYCQRMIEVNKVEGVGCPQQGCKSPVFHSAMQR